MQCLPGQDIPPRGRPVEGLCQGCAERGLRQEGQRGQPMAHLPPGSDGVRLPAATPRPASMGRGRREAAHTADSPPARRPSCACQSCLRVSGNLAWPRPSASDTHATAAMCHKISFTRAPDLTLPLTNSSVSSAAPRPHSRARWHTPNPDCCVLLVN